MMTDFPLSPSTAPAGLRGNRMVLQALQIACSRLTVAGSVPETAADGASALSLVLTAIREPAGILDFTAPPDLRLRVSVFRQEARKGSHQPKAGKALSYDTLAPAQA
ncbi:MAG: hypothetical protein Kow00109_26960 [Acidobacteriota bacterium]